MTLADSLSTRATSLGLYGLLAHLPGRVGRERVGQGVGDERLSRAAERYGRRIARAPRRIGAKSALKSCGDAISW